MKARRCPAKIVSASLAHGRIGTEHAVVQGSGNLVPVGGASYLCFQRNVVVELTGQWQELRIGVRTTILSIPIRVSFVIVSIVRQFFYCATRGHVIA